MKRLSKPLSWLGGAAVAALVLAVPAVANAEDFDLDALIAAAKAEPPLNVYDSTGKIVDQAKNFTAEYGVQATGTKIKPAASLEMVIREAQAHNVQADVIMLSDPAAAMAQLLPEKFVYSWVPPDIEDKIDPLYRDPLVLTNSANVWAYNTELFDKCPVTNIWQLTEPEWKGKVAMQDPLGKASYDSWFNQTAMHADDKIAAAYKAQYGKDLETDEDSATKAWVKALAANSPLLTDADEAAAQAAGAPGQKEPFMALISSAKFRDNQDMGYKLGLCSGMEPYSGWLSPNMGLIASGTDSPNAAKLFIRYMLTKDGIAPQAEDGKRSTNGDLNLPDDEPSGVGKVWDEMQPYDVSTAGDDWDTREDWQDFWRLNYKK
jgi:iron(III) transport system substrate-binding protein